MTNPAGPPMSSSFEGVRDVNEGYVSDESDDINLTQLPPEAWGANTSVSTFLNDAEGKLDELNGLKDLDKIFCEVFFSGKAIDEDGSTPLHHAAFKGDILMVKLLLFLYPKYLDAQDKDGATPLYAAVSGGDIVTIQFLLDPTKNRFECKPDLSLVSYENGFNLLHHAVAVGNIGGARLIKAAYPSLLDREEKHGLTPGDVARFQLIDSYDEETGARRVEDPEFKSTFTALENDLVPKRGLLDVGEILKRLNFVPDLRQKV